MRRGLRTLRNGGEWLGARTLTRRGRDIELMRRAMGFATLALVTPAPLLIVTAAADPLGRGGFAARPADGMGLSGRSARVLTEIISPPREVIGTTSVWGVPTLAVFGIPSGGSVQNGYERMWNLPPGPCHRIRRQATWLCVLTAYPYQEVLTRDAMHGPERITPSLVTGVLFLWWGQCFLLGGQIGGGTCSRARSPPWRA